MKFNLKKGLLIAIMFFKFGNSVFAASSIDTLSGGLFDRETGVAIQGYDTVAYFLENRPVKGSEGIEMEWMGAKWLFSSPRNLSLFKAAPEKYAPQYGGYCAYGVAVDNLVSIDPAKFTIVDGKLYLNYDADIQAKWRKSPEKYISEADKKFTGLLKK